MKNKHCLFCKSNEIKQKEFQKDDRLNAKFGFPLLTRELKFAFR